jgi:uncharacterized protein YbaP (TraB family)
MIIRIAIWLFALLPGLALAAQEPYIGLSGYKAEAIFTANPEQPYLAHSQPNKLAAATAAQSACMKAHPIQNPTTGYCELIRLDDARLTTAAMIKQRLPKTPHPLYLWRYRNGQATVYLGGSVHILKPGLYPLPVQYQQAFDAADRLVLEINLGAYTPQQMQFKAMQFGMLPDAQQLTDIMRPTVYAKLAAITAEYGLPLAQLARFKPSFVTQQLALLALISVGYDPSQGVETYFTQQAQDKEILELESVDFQLGLLMGQPLDAQVRMVEDTLLQMDEFEPFTADLITAWLSGDDETFKQAFDAQSGASVESQAFMRKLMGERNIGMADKISGYLASQGSYFVLVGAAHYIGEDNIIQLLERQGFKGERVYSDQSITK